MKAHGEAISTGVPVDCTGAWVLMHAAMGAIDTLLQSEDLDLDLDSPCYTDADGSNPYYTPLQQLCLLNKKLMPGSWTWQSSCPGEVPLTKFQTSGQNEVT